ncbi:MAG: DNA internalization-related competence protein ComEC/Rec2 [Coriobacteriia bacterium]|nr:DNA internalization-related competence protein ComEC/Rec2 [Coriobacteriia bacterium]
MIARFLTAGGEIDSHAQGPDGALPGRAEWLCRRPYLPPAFFFAIALWLGVALTVEALFGAPKAFCWNLGMLSLIVALMFLVALVRLHAFIGCILVGVALGCAIGSFHAHAMIAGAEALERQGDASTIELVRDSHEGSFGRSAVGMARGGHRISLSMGPEERLMVGDCVVAESFKAPQARNARDCWRDGIVAVASAKAMTGEERATPLELLRGFRRAAIESTIQCGRDTGDRIRVSLDDAVLLLCAMAMGYTDGLYASALYQSVKVDGLAHLVAVSGTHLSLVCGMVAVAFRRLSLPRAAGIAVQCLFIGGYLVFTGAPTSAIRAAMMTAIGMFSFFSKRRPYALGGLSCCVVLMIACDPAAAFSASLLLSAAATAGIVLFSGYFGDLLAYALRLPVGLIRDSVALTAAASIVTGPISACLYGQVSAVSLLANLVITPLVPFICAGGTLVVIVNVALPFVGACALGVLLMLLHGVCMALDFLSRLPGAAFPLSLDVWCAIAAGAAVPVTVWVTWPRPCLAMGCLCVALLVVMACLSLVAPHIRGDAITMLDVGQGDAILLQSRGRSLLIDTGTEDTALLEGLASCGIRSLDAVLITHPDDDHCGSLASLRGIVDVGEVLVAHDLLTERNEHCEKLRRAAQEIVGDTGMRGLSAGDHIDVGALHGTVIGPDAFVDGGGNADSVVLLVQADVDGDARFDYSGVFCGDAEEPQLSPYAREGRIGDVDILKVGHHGSRSAVDGRLLDVLRPEISLISVGAYNRYGHPVPETVELLEESGSEVFRTDENGMISCFLRPDGIHVTATRYNESPEGGGRFG